MMPLGLRPIWLSPLTSVRRVVPPTIAQLAAVLVGYRRRARQHHGLALGKRRWLRGDGRLGDPHGEVAVGHGHRGDLHVLADHDGAGARVDHDARRGVGLDDEVADLGDERVGRCRAGS